MELAGGGLNQVTRRPSKPIIKDIGKPAGPPFEMSDPQSRILPSPPPVVEDDSEVIIEPPSFPNRGPARSKPSRSIRDFFGKTGQSSTAEGLEQDSGSAVTSANPEVTSDQDDHGTHGKKTIYYEDGDETLEANTSTNSITLIEPTGSKRKPTTTSGKAATSASGKKRVQSKKITDEDAEMREMAAAAKKKQKVMAKSAQKGAKSGSVGAQQGSDGNPDSPAKKRGRQRKQPHTTSAQEIIDISSPVKGKQPASLLARKRKQPSQIKSSLQSAEDLDLTNTEDDDDFEVVEHSQSGSQSSMIRPKKVRNRLGGSASAESSSQSRQTKLIHLEDNDKPIEVDLAVNNASKKAKGANTSTAGKPIHSFFAPSQVRLPILDATSPPGGLISQDSKQNALFPDDTAIDLGDVSMENTSEPVLAIDFQDTQTLPTVKSAKSVHDLFSIKPKRPTGQTQNNPTTPIETVNPFVTPPSQPTVGKPGWATHATIVRDALWPGSEETCRREKEIERPRLDLPRRSRQRIKVDPEDSQFWTKLLPKLTVDLTEDETSIDAKVERVSIPPEYAHHPAITSVPSKAANNVQTQLWNDKYRPIDHTEVIGNEIPAKYLVDWLNELAIGINGENSEDRRKVQRKVVKTRKKPVREDDWIVEDDELIREDDGPSDVRYIDDAHAAQQEVQQKGYPDLRRRLTNSILLQGPYGSGKTASIYAAAAELGWEVFEVYPGIGKRSGAHLLQLVGDVGKNHMVGKGKTTIPASPTPEKPKPNPLLQAFAKAAGKEKLVPIAEGTSSIMDLTASPLRKTQMDVDFGFVAQPCDTSDSKAGGPDVRQSLILLEEVDILYEEDKGFWPAVVSLIEESKRPVIMTCNDLTMIPFEELALQTTLLFSPPENLAAKTLLASIAAAEGSYISERYLDRLTQACQLHGTDGVVFHQPVVPPLGRWPLGIDLRAALSQLQLDIAPGLTSCLETLRQPRPREKSVSRHPKTVSGEDVNVELQDLRNASRMADVLSSVDAGIARKIPSILELDDPDHYRRSENDEVGFDALLKPLPLLERQILPMLSKEEEMEDAVTQLASTIFGKDDWWDDSSLQDLAVARQRYQETTLVFLDTLIPLDSHLLPNPILFLDIIPAISVMTHIDDALQAADLADAAAGRARINRRTGREMRITSYFSGNQAYVRQMPGGLEENELQAIRDCRLDLAQFDRTGV